MEKITGIKAISFDADGTLWDFQKVMRQSLRLTLEALQQSDPEAESKLSVDKMIEVTERVTSELKGKVNSWEEVRFAAMRRSLEEVGRPNEALASRLAEFYLKHRFEDIQLYEDVDPTLRLLSSRYVLGLISNGNSYPDRCGLAGMFRFSIFSQDYGFVEKPDPRLYLIALEKAGLAPDEMLHVGDSLKNDVFGAARAGIKAVWLNREGEKADPSINVEYEISSLIELLDILP